MSQKGTKTRWNTTPLQGLNHNWSSACPRMHTHMNDTAFQIKVSLSMRITESILAVILVSSRYDSQFLSLSYAVGLNIAVSVKFDSRELRRK